MTLEKPSILLPVEEYFTTPSDTDYTTMNSTHIYHHVALENSSTSEIIKGIPDNLVDTNALLFRRIIHSIDFYCVPVIASVGILGNILCFMVFMTTYLRKLSSSVYLAALALCDTIFLLTTLFSWIDNVDVDIYHRQGWCQLLTYLGFVTSFLDVWYIVSFTIERYLVVCYPLKRQSMCTPTRAKIVVISLAILGGVLFTFALWTSEVGVMYQRPFCTPKERYFILVLSLTNVDTFVTLIIPTIIIVTCNVRITYAVTRFYGHRENMVSTIGSTNIESPNSESTPTTPTSIYTQVFYNNTLYNRLQMKVTKMLLVVSTAFLVCHIPSHVMRVYGFTMSQLYTTETYLPSHIIILTQKLFQFVYLMNFAINVFLYTLSGRTFRRAMVQLFRIMRRKVTRFFWKKYTFVRSRSTSRRTRENYDLGPLNFDICPEGHEDQDAIFDGEPGIANENENGEIEHPSTNGNRI